jgi:ABC-type Mn2+/Zn2+ transport system permease subunit
MFLSSLGLAMSYTPNLPPGPSIVLLAGLAYVVSSLMTRGRRPA